uniref:Uncharacterized protein n=1 Tax=Rhodopseudomonas palustris (strain BisA53) TaxID=316055 RepID=Q07MD0_RHOP5
MVEPESLILEHLRAMRADMSKMGEWMRTMSSEMTALRQHLSAVMTIQELDHADIASIKVRLDRIEKRLELVD